MEDKKMTKKKISELLTIAKDVERSTGWKVWKMGAYKKDGKTELYLSYHGQGIDSVVYNGDYEAITDFEDIYQDWISRNLYKESAINLIQQRIDLINSPSYFN